MPPGPTAVCACSWRPGGAGAVVWCTTLLGHHRFCRCHQLAEVRDELERVRAEKAALEVQVAQLQQQLDDRQASLTEVRGYLTLALGQQPAAPH